MAYDDKKIEISMGSIINKLSNVDFYEGSSQHSNSNPAQTATPNYSPHSNQVQNSPSPTYVPSSMVTPQSVQKEIQKRIQHDILMDAFLRYITHPEVYVEKINTMLSGLSSNLNLNPVFT